MSTIKLPYKIGHAIGDIVYFKTDTDAELYIIVGICLYQDHPRYLLSNSEKHEIMATGIEISKQPPSHETKDYI